jgi:isoquinoline 1-oxidoreductase beta subunit
MTDTVMQDTIALSRRGFLAASAGALLVASADFAMAAAKADPPFAAWLRIGTDDRITILVSQSEMGQGISTTLPVILAGELGADLANVRTEWSPFGAAYRHPQYDWMFTGNSESSSTFYPIMRRMGAAAREMLVQAASARMRVSSDALTVENGVIRDPASGRSMRFGELAADAAALPVPSSPRLKSKEQLKLVGSPQPRWDIPLKVDGSAVFGIDVKVEGMVIAAIKRAPSPGGALVSFDRDAILATPGVQTIVEIPSGLAVVADRYRTARRALDAGRLFFGAGPLAGYATATQRADHAERLASGTFEPKKMIGDAAKELAADPHALAAIYEIPAQAHATMEPMNATAHVTAERCELWLPTQGVEVTQGVARAMTGLSDDQIVIHRTFLGGGFGRRLLADFAAIAITVSKTVGKPVKVIWSREEDFTYDAYRTAMTHRIQARLGPDGLPSAMAHRVVSPSHLLYVFPRPKLGIADHWDRPASPPHAYDVMAVEGLIDTPYAIANYSVEQNFADSRLAVSVWRTTGHGPNNFALESFIDELAHRARIDPLVYRLSLAEKDARAVAVLRTVADMAGWGTPVSKGHGRGIALAKAFGGYVAQVVEVAVNGKSIKTVHVWTALDCGQTLDPGIAASNTEGGVVWGLSALRTEMTFTDGIPDQTNFDSFNPLHLWEAPAIETRFVESGGAIGGTGE